MSVQYDAAVDPVIAKTKVKEESQVAGRASVLVVPNLNVGNIVYKVSSTLPNPPLDKLWPFGHKMWLGDMAVFRGVWKYLQKCAQLSGPW